MYYDMFSRNYQPEYDEDRSKEIPMIDNDSLLREKSSFLTDPDESSYLNYIIKPNLKMNVDYKVVDEVTWLYFYGKYGGTEVRRFYKKTYSFGAEIEAKLKEIKVVILPTLEEWDKNKIPDPKSIFSSKHDKFKDLIDRIIKIMNHNSDMNLTEENIRLWKLGYSDDFDKIHNKILDIKSNQDNQMDVDQDKDNQNSGKVIDKNTGIKFPGNSLEMMKKFELDDIEVSSNDTLIIERASQKTGKFIFYYEEIKILGYGKWEYCYSHKPLVVQCRWEEVQYWSDEWMKKDERFHIDKWNAPIEVGGDTPFLKKDRARNGITGLQNLGNTWFMNSSIQCLSNSYALTKYFLIEKYKTEINSNNVLGTGGKLAVQFARLLNEMWNEESPVVTPWSFKKIVGNFQPMFSGFAQHDSAELLSFVLDGIHEDLNRVKQKPYYELPDIIPGTPEHIVAQLSWKYHLLRNQSIIVDMMHAQYKSTLCCPRCNNISVTYDPYMMLSLPIPMNEVESALYYFIFYDNKICPIKSKFFMKKSSGIMELRKQIAQQMNVDPWSFILWRINDNSLERIFWRNRTVSDLSDEEGCLFAFQINPDLFENERDPDSYKTLIKVLEKNDNALDMSNDDDLNNSISREWVKVPLRFTMMEKSKYSYYEKRKPQSFPRILWINRSWDLITVHKMIFNFLRYYFDFEINEFSKLSEEEAFLEIFEGLNEENWKDNLSKDDDAGDYCYSLNMVNTEKKSFYSKGIKFFGLNNFNNIPLPFQHDITFGDLIDQFFLEYENKEDSSDDDMDYDSKKKEKPVKQKIKTVQNNRNDGYYYESENKYDKKKPSFELEVFFNKNKQQAAVQKLSRCKKHETFTEINEEADKIKSEEITLKQWFDCFMTAEILGKDNAWYCRKWQDHVEAKKKMELYSTPPILFISLKRFKSGKGSYFKDKLEDRVVFDIDHLDISDIVISNKNSDGTKKGEIIYELYAISNHYGNMGFGHYTAFAKNALDNEWYEFDDSHVTKVKDPSKIITDAAYNLFYKRKDFSFSNEIDYDLIKHECDFENFKLEVSHYAVPVKKEELKTDEEKASSTAAPSGPVDEVMNDDN